MVKGAQKLREVPQGRISQELARLKVISGPEAGFVYIINKNKVTLGRSEDNDIVLLDLKVSRRHAELSLSSNGMILTDLGSSSGFLIKGQWVRNSILKSGDQVTLGGTVLEFFGQDTETKILQLKPQVSPMKPTLTSTSLGSGPSSIQGSSTKSILRPQSQFQTQSQPLGNVYTQKTKISFYEKNKKIIQISSALLLLSYVLPQAEVQIKRKVRQVYKPPEELTAQNLRSFLPSGAQQDARKQADLYFQEGYREFLERNYLRAKDNFDLALQIFPEHDAARTYQIQVDQAMKEEAEALKKEAMIDEQANRIDVAINKYEAIRRLYFKDPANPLYKDAEKARLDLLKKKQKEP